MTRLIWNGKSVSVLWGKRLLTRHRSIYTGLSFSHNPPGSTCLGLEGCRSVEGVLNSMNSGLGASCGSPFPKLTSLALPGGFLWHTEQPVVGWRVAMWLYISTVHVLCSAAGNHITDYMPPDAAPAVSTKLYNTGWKHYLEIHFSLITGSLSVVCVAAYEILIE